MRRVIFLSVLFQLLAFFFSNPSYSALSISPASKNFGNVTVGNSSTFTFTISNTGSTDVTITNGSVQGDMTSFKLKSTTCTGVLTHGHNCSADVTFAPVSLGAKSAQVQIVSSGGSATANLSGTGVCGYSISPTSAIVGYCGAGMSVNVTTQSGCSWSAVSNVSWITITSGSSGSGNGTVVYTVARYYDLNSQTGTMTIAGQTFTVTQLGCPNSILPTSVSFCPEGGTGSVAVTSGAECCVWSATSNASWITFTNVVSNMPSGTGTVSYSVSVNPGPGSRVGTMTIAGLPFTVTQAAPASIAPTSRSHGSGAETGSVSVTAGSGCNWTATSNNSWITITSGSSGTGNGAVNYSLSPNPDPSPRTGTITIAGQTFTVAQATPTPDCPFSISPTSSSFGSSGGTGSAAVTAGSGCSWNAFTLAQDSWITVTSGSSGTGNGTVNYSVSANPGPGSRKGTLFVVGYQIAGSYTISVTITQSAPTPPNCVYSIAPKSRSHGSGRENDGVSVTAQEGCNWTATSNNSWIVITYGSSGTGNGAVNYSLSPNPDPSPRTGTITIAGQTFTVVQAAPPPDCTFSISSTSSSFGSSGGTGSAAVTAGSGCSWNAFTLAQDSWITVTSGSSGTGNGTVNYSVSANPGPGSRKGTLFVVLYQIAGSYTISVTITQSAPTPPNCVYSVVPSSNSIDIEGGTGSVAVAAGPGCSGSELTWAATSSNNWITITSGSSGYINGTVNYSVSANPGRSSRTGIITIAGQTFTVIQDGPPAPCVIKNIEEFLKICPQNDPAYQQIRSDFKIRRNGVEVGDIPCTEPASEMPISQFSNEFVLLQTLRVIYYMDYGQSGHLPWTSGALYDWMKSRIGGFDIRDDTLNNWCCEGFYGVPYVVLLPIDDIYRESMRDWPGLDIALYAHETRHMDGFGHVSCCGITNGCDQTFDPSNLSPYGIQWWLYKCWVNGEINLGLPSLAKVQDILSDYVTEANNVDKRFCDNLPRVVTIPQNPGGVCEDIFPAPDLTGQWGSVTPNCKNTSKGIRCKVSASFTVQNIGNMDTSSNVYVSFYLSGDNTFSPDDTFLKQVSAGKLKKGRNKKITLSLSPPVEVTASGKYVIAVIDTQNGITESNENNNQIPYGPIP